MKRSEKNAGYAIVLLLIIGLGYGIATGRIVLPSPLATVGPSPVGPSSNPGCAWIAGTSTTSNIPAGCGLAAQILQITPQLYNPGIGAPTGTFEKTTGGACKIFELQGASWVSIEADQSSSAGVCITTNAYPVGTAITVQFCEDDATGCVTGDYLNTQTVMYCPLPSLSPSGLCGGGPGAGYVPFSSVVGASTAPTSYFYMPIQAIIGDDPNGMNSGTAMGLYWQWINGTQVATTGAICLVNTGTNACDLPKATSLGNFPVYLTVQPKGTAPASPQSIGFATFTPIDPSLQTGISARGQLTYLLVIEVKATTNNDMCYVTSATFSLGSLSPTVIARSGSSTDALYIYNVPDAWITHTTDASGNPITSGSYTGTFNFNCNQVYNGSGDVVGICATQWAYASLNWIKANVGGTINPEAVKIGGAADCANTLGTVTNGLQIKT